MGRGFERKKARAREGLRRFEASVEALRQTVERLAEEGQVAAEDIEQQRALIASYGGEMARRRMRYAPKRSYAAELAARQAAAAEKRKAEKAEKAEKKAARVVMPGTRKHQPPQSPCLPPRKP